jgi:hypothetical protein
VVEYLRVFRHVGFFFAAWHVSMQPELTRTHLRTYKAVFQHPAARNLEWRDLRALLSEIANVDEEPNGKLKVMRNGHTLVMEPDRHKDVADVDELMRIRHFLERSDAAESREPNDPTAQSS